MVSVVFACAPAVQKGAKVEKAQPVQKLTIEQQREKANQEFANVLEIVEKVEKRSDAVPEIERRYKNIIENYPDAPLAQEIHWRLVELYLRDYNPPRIEDAKAVFTTFKERYPQSPLKTAIEDTMTRFYAAKGMWDELLELHDYRIRRFVETGKIDSPFFLFMYAEALRNLGEKQEALKGYNWVIKTFPGTQMADIAKRRLELIKEGNKD